MPDTEHFSSLEHQLLEHARTGAWWRQADDQGVLTTEAERRPVTIRAAFLKQLVTGRTPTSARLRMVRISGVLVDGPLDFESDTLVVPLFLDSCRLGEVNFEQAQAPGVFITNSNIGTLSATQLRTQNLYLNCSTVAHGVNLDNAEISGVLNLEGTRLIASDDRPALKGHNLVVSKDLAAAGVQADGSVDLGGAHVGGCLDLGGAWLHKPKGIAIDGSALEVDNGAILGEGFVADGEVRLVGALVKGPLDMRGAQISGTPARALSADLLRVEGDMRCGRRSAKEPAFHVTGPLRLNGAHVAGRLTLTGAKISNPGRHKCLFAEGLTVGEDLDLVGATVQGDCSLAGARIGDKLRLGQAVFTEHLNLEDATARQLIDIGTNWPETLSLSGFDYGFFPEVDQLSSVRPRLAWLRRNTGGYTPGPYNHLAGVYRAAGEDEAARRVLIAKQRDKFAWHRKAHPTRVAWLTVAVDRLLDWTIGYGYRPLRMFWWLLGLLVAGWLLFEYALDDRVTPKVETSYDSSVYVLDLLLPVAGLGQRSNVVLVGSGIWWSTLFMLTGWLLGLTLIAGLSGLFKKD